MDEYTLKNTGDSTYTVESAEYGQAMHSVSGAYEEALLKHVTPSGILDKLRRGDAVSVLEVGFGIGYNSLALIESSAEISSGCEIRIAALEKDRGYLPLMKQINFSGRRNEIYHEIISSFEGIDPHRESRRIQLFFGDARAEIARLEGSKFDAVFHDPYSPAKNPELWSVDFFSKIYSLMKTDAVLTTYSSALQVRGAMHRAGFFIGRGPAVGLKLEGTLASITKQPWSMGDDEIKKILSDPKSTPYRDPDFNLSRQVILENRTAEIRAMKQLSGIKL